MIIFMIILDNSMIIFQWICFLVVSTELSRTIHTHVLLKGTDLRMLHVQ